jgi:hypothetical protein
MQHMRETLRPMPENPHRPEHKVGPLMFGDEWNASIREWYLEIGLHVTPKPYRVESSGTITHADGSPIYRSIASEREAVGDYLARQPEDYLGTIQDIAATMRPMDAACRVAVLVPVHNEEKNIYNTLQGWAHQQTEDSKPLDPTSYELNVINNGPEGYEKDESMEAIARFKKDYPHIRLNVLDVELPTDRGNVGLARKLMADTIVQRGSARTFQVGNLYIESGDADIASIDPTTLAKRIKQFDTQPHIDAISGQQDFSPEIISQNDHLFFSLRARQISKALLRVKRMRPENNPQYSFHNSVEMGGWNTGFTAEAYALAGGYLAAPLGEDYDLGKRIAISRGRTVDGEFLPNTHTIARSGVRMQSSPRRHIHAGDANARPYVSFADPQVTREVRDINPAKAVTSLPNGRISEDNVGAFEASLTRQLRFFDRTVGDPEERQRVFKQLMGFLGFGYYTPDQDNGETELRPDWHITPEHTVVIDDIGNIKRALDGYRGRKVDKIAR